MKCLIDITEEIIRCLENNDPFFYMGSDDVFQSTLEAVLFNPESVISQLAELENTESIREKLKTLL